jgi:hypothetical protein
VELSGGITCGGLNRHFVCGAYDRRYRKRGAQKAIGKSGDACVRKMVRTRDLGTTSATNSRPPSRMSLGVSFVIRAFLRPAATRPPSRKKVHVSKILPPPWGLLGTAWRLAPSHQLVGALDPPTSTSVSAPNTRSLIFAHGGVGPGVRPVLGQVSPKRAGGQGGLGSSRLLAGLRSAAPAGDRGAQRSAARKGQKGASKAGTASSVETTSGPLRNVRTM